MAKLSDRALYNKEDDVYSAKEVIAMHMTSVVKMNSSYLGLFALFST